MSDPPWARPKEETKGAAEGAPPDTQPADQAEGGQPTSEKKKKKKRKQTAEKTDYRGAVLQALKDGEREQSVTAWLEKKGLTPDQIDETLSHARARIRDERDERDEEILQSLEQDVSEQKRKDRLYGALWFAGGAVLTIGTCAAAQDAGGGKYVLAWGPMLYGAYRLIKGL